MQTLKNICLGEEILKNLVCVPLIKICWNHWKIYDKNKDKKWLLALCIVVVEADTETYYKNIYEFRLESVAPEVTLPVRLYRWLWYLHSVWQADENWSCDSCEGLLKADDIWACGNACLSVPQSVTRVRDGQLPRVRARAICATILCWWGGWQGVEVAFGVSKRVPWIWDGAVYNASESVAKVARCEFGESSLLTWSEVHSSWCGSAVHTCGLQTPNNTDFSAALFMDVFCLKSKILLEPLPFQWVVVFLIAL